MWSHAEQHRLVKLEIHVEAEQWMVIWTAVVGQDNQTALVEAARK